jgi:hypothetical protein
MDTHGQFLQECELLGQRESGRRWKLQLFQAAQALRPKRSLHGGNFTSRKLSAIWN